MKKLLLLAIVVLGISAVSFGQNGNTLIRSTTASAKLLNVLTLSAPSTELSFGAMTIPTGSSATVVLTPDNDISNPDGTLMLLNISPTKSVPTFTITGDNSAHVQVKLPSGNVPITNGAKTLNVNTFTCSAADKHITLSDQGAATFTIGATLNLTSSESAPILVGRYEGSFNVEIAYE